MMGTGTKPINVSLYIAYILKKTESCLSQYPGSYYNKFRVDARLNNDYT